MHIDNTTENTWWQSFNFHTLLLIRNKPSDIFIAALKFLLISWHTITRSHAQIVRGFKRFRYLFVK